ncbi:MAG TPA: hypothetical protein VHP13_12465 [Gammaproteobacteria bacterium]|jgi:hypothetical protein|nr:hypothetical protein [Gammaproteobacteria bacterium]
MTRRTALLLVFGISIVGVLFSGTLTYREFAAQVSACGPVGQPGTVFGYPACVYGLVMYAVLSLVSAWGLAAKR